MSSAFDFEILACTGDVNKKTKEYKRLKELFPDCDFIFNPDKYPSLNNYDDKYPSVLRFLAKGINKDGVFISEKPLNLEVYKLVNKLTEGKWTIDIYIIKTYDGDGATWGAYGKITDKGILWKISFHRNEDED